MSEIETNKLFETVEEDQELSLEEMDSVTAMPEPDSVRHARIRLEYLERVKESSDLEEAEILEIDDEIEACLILINDYESSIISRHTL